MLDLFAIVVSLITGIQISATKGAGMSLFDAQLHAWKIPPAQFRPLKSTTEKLLKVVANASDSAGVGGSADVGGCGEGVESAEVREGLAELAQVLSSF